MVDWGIACLLAATAGPKSVARTMDAAKLRCGATVSADQLPLPTVVQRYWSRLSS